MVEFSIVFVLFMVCVLAATQAGFWALDSMAATTAAETAARVAALPPQNEPASLQPEAVVNPSGAGDSNFDFVITQLRAGMIGTDVVQWQPSWGPCPQPTPSGLAQGQQVVLYEEGGAAVAICTGEALGGEVVAEVVGYARLIVPNPLAVLGFGERCASAPSVGVGFGLGVQAGTGRVCISGGFSVADVAALPPEVYQS
jgi:hypothetical protein